MPVPYELHLALRYLRFHRGKALLSLITFISVAGVMVGTAALVIALSLMNGFERDFRERILSGSAHLQLLSSLDSTFPDADEVVDRILETEGVQAASPVLYTPGMLSGPVGQPAYTELYAIWPDNHGEVIGADERTTQVLELLDHPGVSGREGIVLGHNLARHLGVFAGDTVRLVVPRMRLTPFNVMARSRNLEVLGTFQSRHFELDKIRAFIHLDVGRSLMKEHGKASWIEMRLNDGQKLATARSALGGTFHDGWTVVDLLEQNADLLNAIDREKRYLFLAIWLIVVVAALNIVSTLVLMVVDKVKDIGTLSAMGARPLEIAKVFMLQGFIIGLLGTVLGLTLGWGLSTWLDRYQMFQLNPDVYYLSYVHFVTEWLDLLMVGLLAMATALAATIYPAWKAASFDPVEALRFE